ncbi:putative ABC transporter substrate binding protein [Moraxella macacae 0408225]|uniref:Putative ABC transporter substrate binding protein n=1 Tax=Moraxella macacae 0408225 TaxID=1230338 RepID=L2F5D3_9GAMM|nr:transporter substrate-binding domain-containing protein [Moraxella macacae]ELA08085.1 putative ABC transporter substrate binding protein [Moraxella macacae 0408225]
MLLFSKNVLCRKNTLLASCLCVAVITASCSKPENQPKTDTASAQASTLTETPTAIDTVSDYTPNPKWETLLVGSEINYPPFEFQDSNSRPTGFEVELLQEIGKAEEFNVQFLHHDRTKIKETLDNNKYRIWASALSIKPERAEVMDFTTPIISSEIIAGVIDNEKNANIKTAADLQGKKIAVNKNAKTTSEYALKLSGSEQFVVPLESFYFSVREVFSGKADAVISDNRVLDYYITQYPNIKIKTIDLNSGKKDLAFAVKKGDTQLLTKLNSGLAKVKENGTYDRLMQKWFGGVS